MKCPPTRLVNRRNSATGTREEKCATDCYVLYAYNHGIQNREIQDVFTSSCNDTIVIKDDEENTLIPPDLYGIMNKIQSDIVDIKKRQAMDSIVLESVRTDINSTLVLFRTIHGTLNSVLSRVGSLTDSVTQCTSLQQDCARMETTLSAMRDRLRSSTDQDVNRSPVHGATIVTSCNRADDNAPKTYAAVVTTPASPPPSPIQLNDTNTRETINITVGERLPEPASSTLHDVQQYEDADMHASGFKAARRKNVLSYFIGNIDNYATKNDIYDYMKRKRVTPTFINVYYGRNGAAAKVNIHADDKPKIEDKLFWPSEIVVRKWVSREEWEKERPHPRRRPRQRHQHWRHNTSEGRGYDQREERAPHYRAHTYREGRQRWPDNRYDDASNYYERNDYGDEDEYRNNEWDPESDVN